MAAKAKPQKKILEEVLLIEVTDANGGKKQMTASRELFDKLKKELELRVVEILKPAGVTMAQHLSAGKKKAAPAKDEAEAKAPVKRRTPAKRGAAAKKEPVPEPEEEVSADPIKDEIESKAMAELMKGK